VVGGVVVEAGGVEDLEVEAAVGERMVGRRRW
jgi:hypothetical protein